MSGDSYIGGVIAPLKTSIEDLNDFSEMLYDTDSKLRISYDGKLAYYINKQSDNGYHLIIGQDGNNSSISRRFISELEKFNLEVDEDKIRVFSCLYHNSGDCPVDMMFVEDYLDICGE